MMVYCQVCHALLHHGPCFKLLDPKHEYYVAKRRKRKDS